MGAYRREQQSIVMARTWSSELVIRSDDIFRLNFYIASDGEFAELVAMDCVEMTPARPSGPLILAVTSTVPPFEDQPTSIECVSDAEAERHIVDAGSSRRLLVLGITALVVAAAVPIAIVLGWQFTLQFFKQNWPILPMGIFLALGFSWAGFHLCIRGVVPARLEVHGSPDKLRCDLVSPADYFHRPKVNRRSFEPAFFFVTRIGIPKAKQSSVKAITLEGLSSLDAKDYVAGICAIDGLWLSLCKSADESACRSRVAALQSEIRALASLPVLHQPDGSRLVWRGDEPEGSGAVYRKLYWTLKK